MSLVTTPPVTTTRSMATPASTTMPFEYTRRWPRLVICLGRNRSLAWKLARRGKSAKPVLAAMIRISIVPAWSE